MKHCQECKGTGNVKIGTHLFACVDCQGTGKELTGPGPLDEDNDPEQEEEKKNSFCDDCDTFVEQARYCGPGRTLCPKHAESYTIVARSFPIFVRKCDACKTDIYSPRSC